MSNASDSVKFVAKNPVSGMILREATISEQDIYLAQPRKAPFDEPVRCGSVIIDTWTGPGSNMLGLPLG